MERSLRAGTIGAVLADAARRLAALPGAEPRLEAELLLAHLLERPRSHLYAWPDRPVPAPLLERFRDLLHRRLAGEPTAYLTGEKEFWSLPLRVTPATLVPRPETELLVEWALSLIPPDARWHLADLGTGSGAIAAAIASERPLCRITASDRSGAALAVARDNLSRLELENVDCAEGDWLQALAGRPRCRLILSNPPYVATGDPALEADVLAHEPEAALLAGDDGLGAIRRIVAAAPAHLEAGGWLLLEHGFEQGTAVRQLLRQAGFEQVETRRDLAGNERASGGRRP